MAMKASVMTMNGRIVSETRNGVRHFHAHDQLGNTIALYDDSGTKTDSYTYWPYGEVRTRTGTTVNPFQFCGAWGYYKDSTGRTYVRARTLKVDLTRWASVDPLWHYESAYDYAKASPATYSDSTGERPSCREALDRFKGPGMIPDPSLLKSCKRLWNKHRGEPCLGKSISPCLMTCLWWKESAFNSSGDAGNGGLNIKDGVILDWCTSNAKCIEGLLGMPKGAFASPKDCLRSIKGSQALLFKLGAALLSCDGLRGYGYGIKEGDPASDWRAGKYQEMFDKCEKCVCMSIDNDFYEPGYCHKCRDCLAELNADQSRLNDLEKGEPWRVRR